MKAHIGVDAGSGMVHSVETSAANVADIEAAHKLIREDDEVVNADAGYVGIEKRKEIAENERLSKVEYRINRKKGELRKREAAIYKEAEKHLEYIGQPQWEREIEYKKSKVRSKVEHIEPGAKVGYCEPSVRCKALAVSQAKPNETARAVQK